MSDIHVGAEWCGYCSKWFRSGAHVCSNMMREWNKVKIPPEPPAVLEPMTLREKIEREIRKQYGGGPEKGGLVSAFIVSIIESEGYRKVAEKRQPTPDWYMYAHDPDECGDTAAEAMREYHPRLDPVELYTSYAGPTVWAVRSPPMPDAGNEAEIVHEFYSKQEAERFCAERTALLAAAPKVQP